MKLGETFRSTRLLPTLSRFALVGGLATVTYLVVANGLLLAGVLNAAPASVVGYLAGMVVSFAGQSRVTFLVSGWRSEQFLRFCVLSAGGLLTAWGAVHLMVSGLSMPAFFGTLVTAALIPAVSFVVMKYWIFVRPGDEPGMSRRSGRQK